MFSFDGSYGIYEMFSGVFKGYNSLSDMQNVHLDLINKEFKINTDGISKFTAAEIQAKAASLELADSLTTELIAMGKDATFVQKAATGRLTYGKALKENIGSIEEIGNALKSSGKITEEQRNNLERASKISEDAYKNSLKNIIEDTEGLSDTIIDLGDNTAKAGNSISTYFKGMVASIKPLLPAILGVTAAIAAFSAIDYTQHSFTRALEDAENMASEYSDAQGKLSSLNEEYKTTQERLSELQSLQSSGSITFAQEIELQNLQESNRDLERQIDLQKSLVEIKSQASAESAKEASTTEKSYVEHKEDEYGGFWGKIAGYAGYFGTYTDPETGLITSPALQWESRDTTTEGLVKSNIEDLEDYESQLESLQEQLKDAPENPNLLRQQENLQEKIATVKSDLNDEAEILQGFIEQSRDSSTGKIHKGMETYVDSWTKSLTSIQNIGKSQKEIDLNNLNNFFSTSGGSAVKKNLENVVKSTKNAKDALIEFKKAGLDLEDIDVSESGFIRYFEDIIKAADEATKAAEKVNNNLTVDDISTAFESKNAGDDYVALNDYIKKAKDLYDQGLVGTDDFKSVAEMMSYNIESSAESFAKNYEKIKRYFTEDTNGNLTGAGINQFLTDLQDLNKGYAVWDENAQRWNINMDNTAQAAKELDIGVGVFESMLGRIKDYDDIGDFDFHSAIDDLEMAKSSLEGLKTIRDEIDDSSKKKLLDSSIEDWESQYSTWENDLATLDENAIIHLKLEYDLASIQQEIDKTKALIEAGDDSVSNYAGVISGNEQYINTAESTLGISDEVKVPVTYEANEESIEALKSQLANVTDEETKKKIQIEIENLQDVQKQFLDAFADSEFSIGINEDSTAEQVQEALQKFSESGSDIEILAKMDIEDSKAKEKIADLLGVEIDDIKVPIDVDVNDALANLEEVDRFELVDKLVKVEALDGGAIPTLELWNSLEMSDKSASLTAQDQATFLISYWNLLTPEEKEAILNTNMQATDDATPTINSVDNAVNSMNLDPNVRINASDYASGTINGVSALLSSLNGRTATTYINTVHTTTGKGDLEGTAHKDGTAGLYPIPKLSNRALAMGSLQDISWLKPQWKTKEDDVALTGELGQELVVKGNRWWTVGDNGTEFAEIPQGSIVFNHKQTEELFKKGFTNSRGNARLAGTAFAGGATGSFSFKGGASIYTPTSSYTYDQPSNDNTAAINDNTAAVEENTEAQENLHDWIAHNVDIHSAENERLSKAIETFEMHANQNAAIDNYVNNSQSYMNTLRQAQNAYMSKANSLGLDEGYIHKIWAGDDFSIQDIQDEELKEKIEKYTEW